MNRHPAQLTKPGNVIDYRDKHLSDAAIVDLCVSVAPLLWRWVCAIRLLLFTEFFNARAGVESTLYGYRRSSLAAS